MARSKNLPNSCLEVCEGRLFVPVQAMFILAYCEGGQYLLLISIVECTLNPSNHDTMATCKLKP